MSFKPDLKSLPSEPGVYLYKHGQEIIYVGKAKNLKKRISQYFQNKDLEPKTRQLVASIESLDYIITETELDALLLENELIKRYKPKFNILLRDDKSSIYIKLNQRSPYPYFSFSRTAEESGMTYIGPFYNASTIRALMKSLRRIFPYSTHKILPKRACLHAQIGRCPNLEEHPENLAQYKKDIASIKKVLAGKRLNLIDDLTKEMKTAAAELRFEDAANSKKKISALSLMAKNISIFEDDRLAEQDQALLNLRDIFGLDAPPKRIESYDVSHMSGVDTVISMVVSTNGLADKTSYRIFHSKIPGNDDFAHMREVITRRFSPKNKSWPIPNLIIIDGGKGQLSSAIEALSLRGLKIPIVGLAKKHESIIIDDDKSGVKLNHAALLKLEGSFQKDGNFTALNFPPSSQVIKLFQRIRDESHRFGVLHHTKLKRKRNVSSELSEIPGIGKQTAIKLLDAFGSVSGIKKASLADLGKVVGNITAKKIYAKLNN
jgi:excinuclease ABC subunit C